MHVWENMPQISPQTINYHCSAGPFQELKKYQLPQLDPMVEKPETTKLPTEDVKDRADEDDHDVDINNSFTGFSC